MLNKHWLKIAFLFAFILLFSKSQAQNNGSFNGTKGYFVKGTLVDSITLKPVKVGSIELVNALDLKIIDGMLLDSTGDFLLNIKLPGNYFIHASAPGYFAKKSEVFAISDSLPFQRLSSLLLNTFIQSIGSVNIEIDGPLIENKIDKLVYNAEKDISSKGGNAADVLRKVPMVEVDGDGNVTMRGSQNIRVLINGKPSGMLASNVRDAVKMIPADIISRVEVITSPSAKYDAEGTAGIINIITKQQKLKGTSGSIFSGGGNRSGNLGVNLNHRNGSTGIGFSIGGYFWRNRGTTQSTRSNTEAGNEFIQEQESSQRNWGFGPWGSLSLDHDFDKFRSASISGRLHGGGFFSKQDISTYYGNSVASPSLLFSRDNQINNISLGFDINADYRRLFEKPDKEISYSVQYTLSNQNNSYLTDQFDLNQINNYRENSKNVGKNKELTLQVDYADPIAKAWMLEVGAKTILRTVNSDYQFDSFSFGSNEYNTIESRNNIFYYNQNVFGGYAQLGVKISKKYSAKFGGRMEFTQYGGGYENTEETFTGKPYFNPIPFVNITRNFGYSGFLRLNYTKRIQRPSMFYLNPYTSFSDPRNITTGNPYLEAEVADLFELTGGNYGKSGGFSTTLYHRRTSNAIETIRQVDSLGIYSTTYGNIGQNATTGFDLNINVRTKKLTVNINGGIGYVYIKSIAESGVTSGLTNGAITYSSSIWGSYKMEKKWSIEAFGRFNAPQISLQGYSTTWYFYTIGVKKRFKNDKGGIGLGFDNPFTWYNKYKTVNEGKDFVLNSQTENFVWGIRFNFDYAFGKLEIQQQPKKKKRGIRNDDLKQGSGDGTNQ